LFVWLHSWQDVLINWLFLEVFLTFSAVVKHLWKRKAYSVPYLACIISLWVSASSFDLQLFLRLHCNSAPWTRTLFVHVHNP
jgi:hypothetical protein